jgi:hypothetical protein
MKRVQQGRNCMTSKASFTPEEWTKVLESVAVTGMAVTAAEPSGLWGMVKEALAGGQAVAAAKADPNTNGLVKAAIADYETTDGREAVQEALKTRFEGANAGDVVPRALETLRQAATILDAKAPADAPAFKAWLNTIAAKVAEASTEGGFLGFGGVKVSEAEKATLAEIAAALGAGVRV